VLAVRWYPGYDLSHRDIEELLVERGVDVDHVTVFRWVHRFMPILADAARFARRSPDDRNADRLPFTRSGIRPWDRVRAALEHD
jgi:transposase-like protein